MDIKRSWIEEVTGVKNPFARAALFEMVAGLIFMAAIFWPHMSVVSLVKGVLIGAIWAVYGFVDYLRVVSGSPDR